MCVQLAHCQNLWANALGEHGGMCRALLDWDGQKRRPYIVKNHRAGRSPWNIKRDPGPETQNLTRDT
jgi:hypothetical protein